MVFKDSIRILPLGGIDEIGKNMTVIEHNNEILVIDCGIGFPSDDLFGVNVLIPDFSYIIKNKTKVRGLIITHAHEDHIGAIQHFLEYINPNIYCTEFTAGVLDTKLTENQLAICKKTIVKDGQILKLGHFTVEFIHTNHSIAGSVAVAITTQVGTIIHTGDFKIDENSTVAKPINMARFKALGDSGVLLLMSDSTNATKEENLLNDTIVGESLSKFIDNSNKRIIVTTFASNIYRMQQIISIAEKNNRKVAISGRSLNTMISVAKNLGYIKFKDNTLIELDDIKNYPDNELLIVTTGSQGEEMSALYRIANGIHKQIEVTSNDKILMSSSTIPGNEKSITEMVNLLMKRGAEVIYDRESEIHTSGHACRKELEKMITTCRPKFFVPVHGEFIQLKKHQEIAEACGVPHENIQIPVNGYEIVVTKDSIKLGNYIGCGIIYKNNMGAGVIGYEEVKTRKIIAEDGCIAITLLADKAEIKKVIIKNIGFLNENVFKDKEYQLQFMIDMYLKKCKDENISDYSEIEKVVSDGVSAYILNETNCSPLVVTTII